MDVVDHKTRALARIAHYLAGRPKFAGLFNAVTAQCQELEVALHQLLDERHVDDATGAQLGTLEGIVGQDQLSAVDAERVRYIKAKILLNRVSGTASQIQALFELLEPTMNRTLVERFPAGLEFTLHGQITPAVAVIYGQFLRRAAVAGVRVWWNWYETADADTFAFDGGTGLGFGDTGNPATGGGLAGQINP